MTTIPLQDVSSLTAVAQRLKAQLAAGGPASLDDTLLPAGASAPIGTAFGYAAGTPMTIAGVQTVPDDPGSTLTISGSASPFGGTAMPASVTFTVDGSGALQTTIDVAMADGWNFPQSFPDLDIYPFDATTTTPAEAHFIYASAAITGYAPWSDHAQETVDLVVGLNFAAWITLHVTGAAISVLADIVGATSALKVAGPFTLSASTTYPVTRLAHAFDNATVFAITKELSIGGLELALALDPPADDGTQDSALHLGASTNLLAFDVRIQNGSPGVTFVATPADGQGVDANAILALPGGSNFTSFIPATLQQQFATVTLRSFAITLTSPTTVSLLELSIGTPKDISWTLIPNVLELDDLSLELRFVDPAGSDALTVATIAATATVPIKAFDGAFDFRVELDRTLKGDAWEIGEISGAYYGTLALGDLIAAVPGAAGKLPSTLSDFVFSAFTADVTRLSSGGYTYAVAGRCDAAFPMLDTQLVTALTVTATYAPGAYAASLDGAFLVGGENFLLSLELSRSDGTPAASGTLLASWTANGTDYLELADVVTAFGFDTSDIPSIPPSLDLSLSSAALLYDFESRALGIGLTSATYGNAIFAALTNPANANKYQFYFGIAAPSSINLMQVPLVESFGGGSATASIDDLQVQVSSYAIDANLAKTLSALISRLGQPGDPNTPSTATTYPSPPGDDGTMDRGVAFSMTLALGDLKLPVSLSTGSAKKDSLQATEQSLIALVSDGAAAAPDPQAAGTWIQVGRTVGPVSFQRVGVRYQNGVLFFLLDASVGLAALTLGLDGLGIGSPLTSFSPTPHLDGLSVSFESGPISITGGLIVVPPDALPPGVTEEYVGQVAVQLKSYAIAGVAAFATLASGARSVFAFAQLRGEVGGTPAFFVTGFMGGFGYDSQLALPAPDDVHTFPFVAGLDDPSVFGSADPTPLAVLNVLMGGSGKPAIVTPTSGQYWIAGGLTFRSFELVLGRALLVVSFGREVEVALLGLASLTLPQGAEEDDAYAYVELQLEVLFKPDEGTFSAIASLTSSSFLITHACHLTGGFAFCLWFDPSPHAGDFVVTVGGYHPAFVVPAWYPQVAPVGFNWAVSGNVTVKGGAYFALTPTAGMAGGSLEVLFQSGDLRAWFTAWANMMVRWKPFYFVAQIGVSIGASYRLDLLFTTVTISVELGASLDLWGPPTGGVVHVDWTIISFSVGFGSGEVNPADMQLDWTQFQSLLPNKPAAPAALATVGAPMDASDTSVLLDVTINGGLTRSDANGGWIVRADELQFTTTSAFPLTSILINPAPHALAQTALDAAPPAQRTVALPSTATPTISIRPMGRNGVTSTHTVSLWNVDDEKYVDLAGWPTPAPQTRNVPTSLWGKPLDNGKNPPASADMIPLLPVGLTLAAPRSTAGASVGPVSPDALIDDLGTSTLPLDVASRVDQLPVPLVDSSTVGTIMSAAASGETWNTLVQAQNDLLAALGSANASPPTHAPLQQLAQQAGQYFSEAPLRTGGATVHP